MPRTRNNICRAWRALNRLAVRSLSGHRRGPDDLFLALVAFARAISCQRRLAKLAPFFFDSAVVDREARERDECRRWMESWQPILDKVYGATRTSEQRASVVPDYPPSLPGPRTRRAVERELAGWNLWMALGRLALARHQQFRPHALPNFSQLARRLQIGFGFGRLACGRDAYQPDPPVIPNVPTVHEMLARAHGYP
jgi:hypothetical protein